MNARHDSLLVTLSVIVAMLASFAALDLAGRVRDVAGTTRFGWLMGGATVMGLGIWSMHFIGMLAFHLPVPIWYDIPLMLLSVAVAIGASLLALIVMSRDRLRAGTLVPAGLLMGAAIAGMHYIGMASMRTHAHVAYADPIVALSILIAIVASLVALWLSFTFRSVSTTKGTFLKMLSAVVMGVAISGMHYTAMAAASFAPASEMAESSDRILASGGLAGAVVVSAVTIIVLALIGAVIDRNVQARVAFTRQLRESEARTRLIVDTALDAVITMDGSGRITDWNAQAERMFGWSPAEAVGQQMTDTIIPARYVEAHRNGLRKFQETGEGPVLNKRIEITAMSRDGVEFPVELAISPAKLGQHWTFSAFIRDLTERNNAAEALRQASKMEAVGQLAGGVAHDFNNLLTVILSYGSMVLDRLAPGDPVREDVHEMVNAADRAAGLTRQLLAFSRKQVMQPQILNINDVVHALEGMLRRLIGEDITLRTSLSPDVGKINADPSQVEQVLMNLVVNARDAMPSGGVLSITTANAELSAASGGGAMKAADGQYVLLTVCDTGTGISADATHRLFDPFFTTKEHGRGTGLGLAMVYGIVKQSEGEINVYSEPGEGTTFKVYFPRCSAAEEHRGDMHVGGVPSGSETILLVEDDPSLRELASRVLEEYGYTVLVADGGRSALAMAADSGATIDAVVTDVVMPGMNGRELVEKLKGVRSGMKVLYMSGYTDDEVLRRGVLRGEAAFLQKPFTPVDLAKKVREVLDAASAD